MQHPSQSGIHQSPIIAAIRDPKDLPQALACPQPVIFLLTGDISNIVDLVRKVRAAGKEVFVHFDLITGLSKDSHALDWLAQAAPPTGIITTRNPLVTHARSLGLVTIQRTFMLDSQSIQMAMEQARKVKPDFLEAMPGIAPEGIRLLVEQAHCPVIAGGLVRTVEQVKAALNAGAIAISTSAPNLWETALKL